MGAMALPVGRTWAHISWLPPSNGADIGAISSYRVTAVPRPFPDSSTASESLVNSSCVESECETRRKDVPGTEMAVNLTDLVPGVHYSLTLIAFSNGSSLQSSPSELLSFTTVAYGEWVGVNPCQEDSIWHSAEGLGISPPPGQGVGDLTLPSRPVLSPCKRQSGR